MRKLVRIGVVLAIIIGTASGVASAKTLFVAEEGQLTNNTQTPADAFAVDVKLTTYNNQCMTLTFSSMAAVSGAGAAMMGFEPTIDEISLQPTVGGITWWANGENGHWDMASFMWQMCGLNIGRHTVRIKFFPEVAGNTGYIGPRLLKIDIKSGKIVPLLTMGAELEDEGMAE
jgi:hypothetical protein